MAVRSTPNSLRDRDQNVQGLGRFWAKWKDQYLLGLSASETLYMAQSGEYDIVYRTPEQDFEVRQPMKRILTDVK